ncbi:hypothetical protein [Salimicrobium flavidum]|uniref:hypothetical protein n=1 Tax=Salimicrobium flavidum TaxID=570947 RepID=UPI00117A9BCF|nr:hypothetical protein [Salimicrobium flavidum]
MRSKQETNAIISLVLGLLSLPVPLIGWLLGMIAVSYARRAMKRMVPDDPKRWYATLGMVCGIIGIVMDIGIVIVALIVFIFL